MSGITHFCRKGAGQMSKVTACPAYLLAKPVLSTNRRMSSPNTSVPIGWHTVWFVNVLWPSTWWPAPFQRSWEIVTERHTWQFRAWLPAGSAGVGQLYKQFSGCWSGVVCLSARRQLLNHCHGPPYLGGLVAGGWTIRQGWVSYGRKSRETSHEGMRST